MLIVWEHWSTQTHPSTADADASRPDTGTLKCSHRCSRAWDAQHRDLVIPPTTTPAGGDPACATAGPGSAWGRASGGARAGPGVVSARRRALPTAWLQVQGARRRPRRALRPSPQRPFSASWRAAFARARVSPAAAATSAPPRTAGCPLPVPAPSRAARSGVVRPRPRPPASNPAREGAGARPGCGDPLPEPRPSR